MRLSLIAVLFFVLGCDDGSKADDGVGDGGPPATDDAGPLAPPPIDLSACPGEVAPSLDDCATGLFHADCGGDGEPVLACTQVCKWFQGGCPADGYRPIDCPLGDPFCVQTPDGHWPYEPGVVDDTMPQHMCDQLDLIGDAVVTPTSGPLLELRIDPEVAGAETATLECEGVGLGSCNRIMRGWTFPPFADTPTLGFRDPSLHGDMVAIELVTDEAGQPAARAYLLQFTDIWPYGESCTEYVSRFGAFADARPLITGGEVVLSAEPGGEAEVRGEATLLTAAGGTMTLRF
jgi:hypothetical protein